MKVIYLISLQNPNRFYTVVFLYYCSSLTCNATGDAADCLETPGVRDDALVCLLKSDGKGKNKEEKQV